MTQWGSFKRIWQPSTQSGKGTSHHWRVDWDILQGSSKFENTLMGWTASADYVQGKVSWASPAS